MTDGYRSTPTGDELSVGETGPAVVVEDLDRQDFVKYAGASGDFNPIHYDDPLAREAGYETVFAQGMLTAGIASHQVADWFGLANVTAFGVRFRSQVWPGDTVKATGEITSIATEPAATVVDADLVVESNDDEVVLTGSATARLPTD